MARVQVRAADPAAGDLDPHLAAARVGRGALDQVELVRVGRRPLSSGFDAHPLREPARPSRYGCVPKVTVENDEQDEYLRWPPLYPQRPGPDNEMADRIRRALVDTVGEQGYGRTDLEAVLDRAGLERADFDAQFSSFEECLLNTWTRLLCEFLPRSKAAFERGEGWRDGLRRQAWDLLRYVEEDVNRARFLIDSAAEELVQAHRDVAMGRMVDYVHLGRFAREEAATVPRATAEALVGAIWNGLAVNIREDPDFEALRGGSPQILYLTMMAYLGQEAAQEELRRGPEDLARYERGEI